MENNKLLISEHNIGIKSNRMIKSKRLVVFLVLIMLIVVLNSITVNAAKKKPKLNKWKPKQAHVSMSYKQKAKNDKNIVFEFNNYKGLVQSKKVDKLKISLKMKIRGDVVNSKNFTISLKKAGKKFNIEAPDYGRWYIRTTFYKKNKKVYTKKERIIGVSASTYNIAVISATTPVLVFSLKYFYDQGTTQDDKGNNIPTYVFLRRPDQFNWNKLPNRMKPFPVLSRKESLTIGSKRKAVEKIKSYVIQLKMMNPKAKFNFYFNDNHLADTMGPLVYETKLKSEKYKLRLITDGSLSYESFKSVYEGEENVSQRHNEMMKEFKKWRDDLRSGKRKAYDKKAKEYTGFKFSKELGPYNYAIVESERDAGVDCQWWLIRKSSDTLVTKDLEFQKKVLEDTQVTSNYINGLLGKVQEANKTKEFKALYNFDDKEFKETRSRNKKIMVILGTSKANEDKFPIDNYIDFTKAFHGDSYEYYYKGHPGYITERIPERMENFKKMGLKVLDSSIAAELFAFYNPDIHLSGYESSTFMSVGTKETNGGIFNKSKAVAYNGIDESGKGKLDYAAKVAFFMTDTKITPPSEEIKELIKEKKHHNYLVEFNTSENDKNIAIYDADDKKITYFKYDNGAYVEVDKL